MKYRLHKEGRPTLWVSVLVCLIFCISGRLLFPVWGFWIVWAFALGALYFVMRFFRVPVALNVVYEPDGIYSPCAGKVVEVQRAEETEVFGKECMKVAIFMSIFNVHLNYYPVSGRVSYYKYHKGKFLVAWLPKSSTDNEHATTVVTRNDGVQILARQIAGAVARRIATYGKEGDSVSTGGELGFIRFGSRVDVYMPLSTQIEVKVGDVVQGGVTRLGRLAEVSHT